jgi:hypothetical protein
MQVEDTTPVATLNEHLKRGHTLDNDRPESNPGLPTMHAALTLVSGHRPDNLAMSHLCPKADTRIANGSGKSNSAITLGSFRANPDGDFPLPMGS